MLEQTNEARKFYEKSFCITSLRESNMSALKIIIQIFLLYYYMKLLVEN